MSREYTGGSTSYYQVPVANPTSEGRPPYIAECNDIIEALGMNYAEANVFKAVWRSCAARNLNLAKKGYDDLIYDAEKAVFFAQRMLEQRKRSNHHALIDPAILRGLQQEEDAESGEPRTLTWDDET